MGWKRPQHLLVAETCALVMAAMTGALLTACGRSSSSVSGSAPAGGGAQEVTVMLPGNLPLAFVRIPAGMFAMGSPIGERGRSDDEAQHQVTLTREYYIGKYEVTQAQWRAIMRNDPSYFSSGGEYPVEQVSWKDITEPDGFLATLNGHLTGTGQPGAGRMRLPTEAEWERAARGGTTTRFSYGDALECKDACRPCPTHSRYMWWCGDQPGRPAPIGGKQPNPYGLYDVHGNLWEWVQDRYGPYESSPQEDPQGPRKGAGRVVRGGGLEVPLEYSRSAARRVMSPDDRHPHIGLRLAWSP